jgi:hypothetical protein
VLDDVKTYKSVSTINPFTCTEVEEVGIIDTVKAATISTMDQRNQRLIFKLIIKMVVKIRFK